MNHNDYYKVLGVSRSASQDEIRKAYKKIARENHPDVKPGDNAAAERFKQAAEAYEVLGDEEKRKKYDKFGPNWKHADQAGGPFPGGGAGGAGPVDIDFESIFGRGGGGGGVDLEDLFGGMFGQGRGSGTRRQAQQPRRGQDLEISITIPFELAARGGEHDVSVQRIGKVERLSVKIPAGVKDGGTIRLAGQGQPGRQGGPAGDLMIKVNVAPHPFFRREGQNVLVDVPVSLTEAALGAKVDVPTLTEGVVTLTIPPGTASGTKLRLRGKGFVDPKTRQHGDQFVAVKIVPPKELDDRGRELLEEFAQLQPQNPRAGLW